MVNSRGRVMYVHPWEVENLRAQGCRVIVNPKEEYYPAYDQSLNPAILQDKTITEVEDSDILECEVIT